MSFLGNGEVPITTTSPSHSSSSQSSKGDDQYPLSLFAEIADRQGERKQNNSLETKQKFRPSQHDINTELMNTKTNNNMLYKSASEVQDLRAELAQVKDRLLRNEMYTKILLDEMNKVTGRDSHLHVAHFNYQQRRKRALSALENSVPGENKNLAASVQLSDEGRRNQNKTDESNRVNFINDHGIDQQKEVQSASEHDLKKLQTDDDQLSVNNEEDDGNDIEEVEVEQPVDGMHSNEKSIESTVEGTSGNLFLENTHHHNNPSRREIVRMQPTKQEQEQFHPNNLVKIKNLYRSSLPKSNHRINGATTCSTSRRNQNGDMDEEETINSTRQNVNMNMNMSMNMNMMMNMMLDSNEHNSENINNNVSKNNHQSTVMPIVTSPPSSQQLPPPVPHQHHRYQMNYASSANMNSNNLTGIVKTRRIHSRSKRTLSKRKRVNWSQEDNVLFMKIVNDNKNIGEARIRRKLAETFANRRTHEQCANHLRILRAQNKLPPAQEDHQNNIQLDLLNH